MRWLHRLHERHGAAAAARARAEAERKRREVRRDWPKVLYTSDQLAEWVDQALRGGRGARNPGH